MANPNESLTAAAWRDLEATIDSALGDGTFERLSPAAWRRVFLRPPAGPRAERQYLDEQRDADLDHLAHQLAPGLRIKDHDRPLLRERAKRDRQPREEAKVGLLKVGLLWASAEMATAQTVRLGRKGWIPGEYRKEWSVDVDGALFVPRKIGEGRPSVPRLNTHGTPTTEANYTPGKYVKGGDGKKITVRPLFLPFHAKLAWYLAGAKRAAVRAMRDEAFRSEGEKISLQDMVPIEGLELPATGLDAGLDAIIASEESQNRLEELQELLAVASPREAQVIEGMLRCLAEGRPIDEARAQVTDDLGLGRRDVNTYLRRLREKAR